MRIGFDAKRAFLNTTGLGNYSRYAINGLARMYPENSYHLYTPTADGDPDYTPPEGAEIIQPASPWARSLKSYWRSYGITKRLSRDGMDIYHGLSNEIPYGIEKSGVPGIVTIHDLIFLKLPELYRSMDRRIYLSKSKYAVQAAERIIAISEQTKNDLVELLDADEKKIRVIYQGCNPWFMEKPEPEKLAEIRKKYKLPKQYLLYVGTIEERKNLFEIIKAVHTFNIDIPVVAVGRKTAYAMQIEEYIAEHGIKNIHFYQHIDNRDLPGLYRQAEAFVYPSRYEGFGIPVLEALNSGIPVITSKGGCLEETAGEGGLKVTPGDTEELGHAIKRILEDSALRSSLVTAGAVHARMFREEVTIPALYNVYKECIR